ncbi:MAG: hypothetical protein QNJ45_28745 [Ardenticatenaceae bacterium]|nr:hypothetical protein [Ardenticatenaceae bacterium]
MNERQKRNERLLAIFMIGFALFNFPLIAVFNRPDLRWFGIPALYVYLFFVWLLLIAGVYFFVNRFSKKG